MDEFCLMIALKISKADSGLPKEITHAVKMPLPQFYREPISLVTPPDVDLDYCDDYCDDTAREITLANLTGKIITRKIF